jgi:hypothetical protein
MENTNEINMTEDGYEYTLSQAVFNIASSSVNLVTNPNVNYTANISSKENDAILLSESYFLVEYKVNVGGGLGTLIPNWFLSLFNSFNLSINSFSLQMNSINAGRTFPMLAETLRYLTYENSDFNKFSSMERSIFQKNFRGDNTAINCCDTLTYYPIEFYAQNSVTTNHCIVKLRDIFPSAGTFNQVSGLLSMSMVLSYNQAIQNFNFALEKLTINSINFHYPVRTFNMKNSIDIDLNYISTYGVLNGTVPKEETFTFLLGATPFDTLTRNVVMSNIQLSVNKIYKLIIFPIFTVSAGTTGTIAVRKKQFELSVTGVTSDLVGANQIEVQTNLASKLSYLGSLPGSCGSQLFAYRNVKIVINGSTILPSNVVQLYTSPYFGDWYNYDFSFNGAPLNKLKKPNLFFDSNMYSQFGPIIVDLSNATSNNSFNSISFSYEVYNTATKADNATGPVTYSLRTDYVILNEIVLNDS